MMEDIALMPPYLPRFGVRREVNPPLADLITIKKKVPYPVLSTYEDWCKACGIEPYAGGTFEQQGKPDTGFIDSGYRDGYDGIGARWSAHKFALALDPHVYTVDGQLSFATKAENRFMRVGFYPDKKIMHLDLVPLIWIRRYGSVLKRYWVRLGDTYYYFPVIVDAMNYLDMKGRRR